MPQTSLSRIQKSFSDSLFGRNHDSILEFIKGRSVAVKNKRLNIYRNNVVYSLTSALAELYPVVKRLVGNDFFNATAYAYLQKHPPRRAAMVYFGEEFPGFLQGFEHTVNLPWLADVACLELMWHQSYHAEDAVPLTVKDFAVILPDELVDIKLELHPSTRFLHSRFPVLQIWFANQEEHETDETIDLDSGGVSVCLYRSDYEVILIKQDSPSHIFLKALSEGETLGNAVNAAQAIEPEFDLTSAFAECISAGLFTKITRGLK